MKKILIILPNLIGGGAERLHISLGNKWAESGFIVQFLLLNKHGQLLPMVSDKVDIVELKCNKIRNAIFPINLHLRKYRADIILSAMWPLTSVSIVAWLLSGKKGKLFVSEHIVLGIEYKENLNISRLLLTVTLKATYTYASGIIAVSEGVKGDLCKIGYIPHRKVKVIYNPASTGLSSGCNNINKNTRELLWGVGFDHHILSVGSLKEQKDHRTLILSFSKIYFNLNAKLVILGDGHLRKELEELIESLGLQDRILLPGFYVDPSPWYLTADLFVLSSRWEGFGNVIVEALECGLPVVSTDCKSGPSEILNNKRYGKLTPVQNIDLLSNSIIEALNEPWDVDKLKERAQDFSVDNISRQYLKYFNV